MFTIKKIRLQVKFVFVVALLMVLVISPLLSKSTLEAQSTDICAEYGYTKRHLRAKVFDFLLVNDEIETLYLRMEQMHKYVDRFIVLESELSFSRKSKPLYFSKNREMFKKFNILHLVLRAEDIPVNGDAWAVESYTRSHLFTGAVDKLDLTYNDVILLSDLDEIPKPKTLNVLKSCYFVYPLILTSEFYYYSFEYYVGTWNNPRATMFKGLNLALDFQNLRSSAVAYSMPKAAWHCSFCFSTYEQFERKLNSFSHQEFNNHVYKNRTRITNAVRIGKSLFDGNQFKVLENNEDIPEFLVGNKDYWYMTRRHNQTQLFDEFNRLNDSKFHN